MSSEDPSSLRELWRCLLPGQGPSREHAARQHRGSAQPTKGHRAGVETGARPCMARLPLPVGMPSHLPESGR